MRKIHSLGLVGAVALVLAAVVAPAANGAVTRVETDQFSGVASAQALDLSLLGRKLTFGIASADSAANVVANTLNQKASGIGTLLSPKTAITAAQGEKPTEGGRACFQPPLGEALAGANLPSLLIGEVACGEAVTKGDVNSFEAIGTGTVASLKLNATQILKPALDVLQPLLGTVGNTPVGELLKATDAPAKTAVSTLNGVLGSLLGQGSVVLPTLEPSQTVKTVVDRLQDADLLRVNIGNAIAKNTGTADKPDWRPGDNLGPPPYFSQPQLDATLLRLAAAGINPHMHADGDGAVREGLNAIAAMRKVHPYDDVRPAIAHDTSPPGG